ncbi:hypothetical protein BRAS3843_520186 [Bradyrhizobium sp. STM 3843]|nr:hypothetical protein BRAS3843_520186 [Bradyrhizobium sp. STM 3843]
MCRFCLPGRECLDRRQPRSSDLTRERTVGLSWQQGPLSTGAIGRFLVPEPLPKRLLYVERLRRRMRVRFGGQWIADSEDVLLLFEPGRYPVAYFPETDVSPGTLQAPWSAPSTPRNIPISGSRPGTASGLTGSTSRREARGSTATCPPTRMTCTAASPSRGVPWMRSTRKTKESSAMPQTPTTASTFARLPVTSWSATVTGSSRIRNTRWCSTNPASRRAGMCHGPTSTNPPSPP